MISVLRKLARALLGEYALFRIYESPVEVSPAVTPAAPPGITLRPIDRDDVVASADEAIRVHDWYLGSGALGFGCFDGDRLVGVCFYWYGERYSLKGFWPLGVDGAKLMQVFTLPETRGRGIATMLIRHASGEVAARGFRRQYARIWHSNLPSLTAFERAGWEWVATVLQVYPFGSSQPRRLIFHRPTRRDGGRAH